MGRFVRYILLLAVLLVVSCSTEEGVEVVNKPLRVYKISCEERSYKLDYCSTVEIPFRVEDPRAVFNYAFSSPGCQVQLRLESNVRLQPESFSPIRVRKDSIEKGLYYLTVGDNGTSGIYRERVHVAIKYETGELILSNVITIVSSNFVSGIAMVRLSKSSNPSLQQDVNFVYDPTTQCFTGHIDKYVSNRTFIPEFECDGVDYIEVNGKRFDSSGTPVDFSSDPRVVAHVSGSQLEYRLHLTCFTGLPVLRINTPGMRDVWSKDEWVECSMLSLDGMAQFENISNAEVAIRGRGNSTWGYEKKPYSLKFSEKQEVMGMPKHKRWVLLANYMDRTLLRNRVAFYLSEQTSLEWTPKSEYVELILNGKHLGQYLLCEQVRVDNDRIDITEMSPQDNSGSAITGGYLLELDFHYDNEWQWRTSRNIPFAVKYPDEEDLTNEQYQWIMNHIAEVEGVLYGGNYRNEESGYRQYIDAQSFVDYWLIYEICVNHELANPGSVYLSKDRSGKLVAGPIWDFDWGTFSFNASPQAQYGLFMQHAWWYDRLFDDPDFKALASERWALLKPHFESVFDFIERERDYISRSWDSNFSLWGISTNINGDEQLSKEQATDRLIEITRRRIEIIDSKL